MKSYLLTLSLFFLSCYCLGQQTINFIYTKDIKNDSFYLKMYSPLNFQTPLKANPFYKSTLTSFSTNKNISQTSVVYDIKDTLICFSADLFGKEIIVIPKDTISVTFQPRQITEEGLTINKKYLAYWKYEFDYKGKNQYIYKLLDSLTFYTGYVYKDFIRYQQADYDLSHFFDTVTYRYQARIQFIDEYCSKYEIPDNIKRLVNAECYAAYVINLLSSFPVSEPLPYKYDSTLKNIRFNTKFFFKTPLYHDAALQYIEKYKINNIKNINDDENIYKSTYYQIGSEFQNFGVREFLQSRYLISKFKKNYTCFNILYQNFKKSFPQSSHITILDSLLQADGNRKKFTFEDALNSIVSDTSMSKKTLKSILSEKQLIIIDCWATWCIPCINEIPFSEKLKNEYKEKLKIIYLSFDKKSDDWIEKQTKLGVKENSYLLKENFKSDFATFFYITSIPRYILIDKTGKIVDNDAPRPSNPKLKGLIDKYLNE